MPLVRIDLPDSFSNDAKAKLGDVVHEAMVATLDVPLHDRFQIITEHTPDNLHIDASYLDVARSKQAIIIQLILNAGRSLEQKKRFYRLLADLAHQKLDVRKEDVMISLVEVAKDDWSFGNGEAQYAN